MPNEKSRKIAGILYFSAKTELCQAMKNYAKYRKSGTINSMRLSLSIFDENQVKDQVDIIWVHSDGTLQTTLQNAEYFDLLPN